MASDTGLEVGVCHAHGQPVGAFPAYPPYSASSATKSDAMSDWSA